MTGLGAQPPSRSPPQLLGVLGRAVDERLGRYRGERGHQPPVLPHVPTYERRRRKVQSARRVTRPNDFGVLDHHVTLPPGETVDNPMRVTADGTGSEIVFSLRRRPGVSDQDFERDADAVRADLLALKRRMESI